MRQDGLYGAGDRRINGRVSYLKEGGLYDMRFSPASIWVLTRASNAETAGSYYAKLFATTTKVAMNAENSVPVDLRMLADADYTAYWVYFTHFYASETRNVTAITTTPFCRDSDCDGVGATVTGGYDGNDDNAECRDGKETCTAGAPTCLQPGAAPGSACGDLTDTMIEICGAQQQCRNSTPGCGHTVVITGLYGFWDGAWSASTSNEVW